ncbi:MAG: histidinol dehydrogenase [Acidimicrobiia bacterium]|nr:MAG: histidinol dehydrogenase [Acidimicrobiia bacterium]
MSRLLRLAGDIDGWLERRNPIDPGALTEAASIVEDVRDNGEEAVRRHSERFGDLRPGEPMVNGREDLEQALTEIDPDHRRLLQRTAGRIHKFAEAQRSSFGGLDVAVDGGRGGHRWLPVEIVGAYAPGGRYPLPSTVLMTVIPARVAGVGDITVASPAPTAMTMAAAAVAGADRLLRVGGAQGVAALAFGIACPPVDLVVGPGNRWVTAAKKHLYGEVGIDGLAGPSEIVVVADEKADPGLVAADLLAQAEHDPHAVPILITTSNAQLDRIENELADQLVELSTAKVARAALSNGFCLVVEKLEEAVGLSNRIAPEHLALHLEDAGAWSDRFRAYGSIFIGPQSAEAFADYGVGPNHVLPTGGGARFQSGLSVLTFLRSPTWLDLAEPGRVVSDTVALASLEGLEAHSRAAERRSLPTQPGTTST